jgi:hypothetical protein
VEAEKAAFGVFFLRNSAIFSGSRGYQPGGRAGFRKFSMVSALNSSRKIQNRI